MSKLSRRSLVAGAASLPALAAGAAVASEPAKSTSARLVALGEELKGLLVRNFDLSPKVRQAYQIARDAAGFEKLGMHRTERQQKRAMRRFKEARKQSGYDELYGPWSDLSEKMNEVARSILEIEATDRVGDGIHAVAALVLSDHVDRRHLEDETHELLWRMAASRMLKKLVCQAVGV